MDTDEPFDWPADGGADEFDEPTDDLSLQSDEPPRYDETGEADDAAPAEESDEPPDDEPADEPAEDAAPDLDAEPAVPEARDEPSPVEPVDPLPGTDPDLDTLGDDTAWTAEVFPPALEFDAPPEPVDGMPWADPRMLGDDAQPSDPVDDTGRPPAEDLYAYDGQDPPAPGEDPWAALTRSDDPATSTLARFWAADA